MRYKTRSPAGFPLLGLSGLCFLLTVFGGGCTYNPVLEREQFLLVSDPWVESLSQEAWLEARRDLTVSGDKAARERVQRVATRVLLAAGEDPLLWETELFSQPDINAFALPGRRIGVYSGLLEYTLNDDELAAVLGHEIAHVKLHHGAERLSQDLAARGVTDLAAAGDADAARIFGLVTTLGLILPYSRRHELEADRSGLQYMARAGFDPFEAVALWARIAAQTERAQPIAFLSTHPADSVRITALRTEATRLSLAGRAAGRP